MHAHIISAPIVLRVKPHELIKALMAAEGVGAYPLAKKLSKTKNLQSQIHRFITGEVNEPARTTAEPLARHFGIPVEAIYSEREASKVARERKIGETARQEAPPAASHTVVEQPLAHHEAPLANAVRVLGEALATDLPPHIRSDIAQALAKLAERNGEKPYQQAVLALLDSAHWKRRSAA
jgi:hypothetical protein